MSKNFDELFKCAHTHENHCNCVWAVCYKSMSVRAYFVIFFALRFVFARRRWSAKSKPLPHVNETILMTKHKLGARTQNFFAGAIWLRVEQHSARKKRFRRLRESKTLKICKQQLSAKQYHLSCWTRYCGDQRCHVGAIGMEVVVLQNLFINCRFLRIVWLQFILFIYFLLLNFDYYIFLYFFL